MMDNCVNGKHIGNDFYMMHKPSGLKMCIDCAVEHRDFDGLDKDIQEWYIIHDGDHDTHKLEIGLEEARGLLTDLPIYDDKDE